MKRFTAALSNLMRPRTTEVSRYHKVSLLDFVGAKDNGGGGDVQSFGQIVSTSKPTMTINIRHAYIKNNIKIT